MAIKKSSKTKKTTPCRPNVKTSVAEQAQINAELRQQLAESLQREKATAEELQDWKRQFTEAFEQQTSTSEILRVIASSPTDLQPVLDTIAENAARVCGASDAIIRRLDGDVLPAMAHYGSLSGGLDLIPLNRGSIAGRAVIDRQTIHVNDLAEEPESEFASEQGFPTAVRLSNGAGDAFAPGGRSSGCCFDSANGGSTVHREAGCFTQNIRRPGRDCHRERAPVQRTKGVVGAANRNE